MRLKIFFISLVMLMIFGNYADAQYCTNFKASYDGVRLKLSGLKNSGKVKVSVSHNGGITYTDITSLLPSGQDNAVLVLKVPIETVLMEGSDLAASPASVCQKSFIVKPTNIKPSAPILSIIAPRGVNTIKTNKGTLNLTASVLPMSVADKSVSWSVTSGTDKASVNSNGLVTAICDGTATVTAKSVANPNISKSINIVITGQTTKCTNSIEEVNSSFVIYPNPVKDVLSIKSEHMIIKISIFNTNGSLLKQVDYLGESNVNLDVNQYPKGMYILKLETSEGVGVHKFVKE